MSGGHFDYDCFRISEFAMRLQHEIDINHVDDSDHRYAEHFSNETITTLKKCQVIIEKAGKLAHEVEWLSSGGCRRCATYGSIEQRTTMATFLAKIIDAAILEADDA